MSVYPFTPGEAEQLRHGATLLGTSVFLYVGPDQFLPLASGLAAVLGFLLIVWHGVAGLVRKIFRFFRKEQTTSR